MNHTYIKHIDCLIPEGKLFLKDIKDEFSGNQFFKDYEGLMGFAQQYLHLDSVCVEDQLTMEEMLTQLLRTNLDNGAIVPEKIDYIIVAPIFNTDLIDFGQYVQSEFGMNKALILRSGDNYCTNIDLAMKIARHFIDTSNQELNLLVLSGSQMNNFNDRILGNYAICGDSASLMLLSNEKRGSMFEIIDQEILVKGALGKTKLEEDHTILHFQSYLEVLTKLLEDKSILKEDIKQLVFHNVNTTLLEHVVSISKYDKKRIFKDNEGKFGHLGTTDLLLNLKDCYNNCETGEHLVSLNLGIAGTYASTLYQRT